MTIYGNLYLFHQLGHWVCSVDKEDERKKRMMNYKFELFHHFLEQIIFELTRLSILITSSSSSSFIQTANALIQIQDSNPKTFQK